MISNGLGLILIILYINIKSTERKLDMAYEESHSGLQHHASEWMKLKMISERAGGSEAIVSKQVSSSLWEALMYFEWAARLFSMRGNAIVCEALTRSHLHVFLMATLLSPSQNCPSTGGF